SLSFRMLVPHAGLLTSSTGPDRGPSRPDPATSDPTRSLLAMFPLVNGSTSTEVRQQRTPGIRVRRRLASLRHRPPSSCARHGWLPTGHITMREAGADYKGRSHG